MTFVELTKEYVRNHVHYEVAKRENGTEYAKEVSSVTTEQAFLDGLKAGRPEWHDLRKNPDDLPDGCRYVWTNVGTGYYEDGWYDDYGRLYNVIAWCEPKFEEE